MSYSWMFASAAVLFWGLATLLYLRGGLMRRFKEWRGRRAAARKPG